MMHYSELALEIATKAHEGQVDKAGEEYIKHPIAVASMVNGDIVKAVALLHDIVEDTDVTFDTLEAEGFSSEVVNAVDAITKRDGEGYGNYLQRVANNPIAAQVKQADLKHNSQLSRFKNPSRKDEKRCKKYIERIEMLKSILR